MDHVMYFCYKLEKIIVSLTQIWGMWKYTISIKFIKIQIVIFFLKLEFFSSWHFDPRKIWFVSLQIDTNVQFVFFLRV